jgi:hypothetical protein
MAGLLPETPGMTVLPNWMAVMMAITHIRVERSDWNDVAVEAINFRNFVIQSPWIAFVVVVSSFDRYRLDN